MHLEHVLFGVAVPLWMGFGGTKDLWTSRGGWLPTHLAGGALWARLAMASAAMAAGFAIASLAVPGLLLPGSIFLVGSVLI